MVSLVILEEAPVRSTRVGCEGGSGVSVLGVDASTASATARGGGGGGGASIIVHWHGPQGPLSDPAGT
jgi:hypothetical protein